jgi:hypothetical protein
MKAVYEKLAAYLEIVIPELEKWIFSDRLELSEGINVMDLSGMRLETQHLIIASTIEYAFANLDHVIVIIPEAWETIPQSKMTPVKWVAQQFIRKGAALGNYLWLDSQDIGGIDKTPLRQCDNWLMGRMKEAHEVERILKQLLGMKVAAAEIQTLPLGHFYAAIGNDVKKVYVLPVGVPESVGVDVARGIRTPESVRDNFLKRKVMEVDDLVWKEKYEEERRKREEIEKEFTRQVERLSELKAKEKINGTLQEIAEKYVSREEYKATADENFAFRQHLEQDKAIIERLGKENAVFAKLKEALAEIMLTTSNISDVSVGLQRTMTIIGVQPVEKNVTVNTEIIRGKILALAQSGFLNAWHGLGDIYNTLIEKFSWTVAKSSLQVELSRMVDEFLLGAKEDKGRGQRVYRLAEGVKFKEAES